MQLKNNQQNNILYAAILVLLLPALLLNLGLMPFIDDEAIRALVALEMKLSGNYIVPTLNGEFYYKKPPLFNWILLGYFNIFGEFNEFSARFATIISLLFYGGTIFYFLKKQLGKKHAFLTAIFFITCGRVLIWESLLGLIDITYSWITFVSFMVIFHQFKRGNFYKLFLISYFCMALGFLMKGLPSILFQGLTLLAFFTYKKQFKKLFSVPHILGGLLFLTIIGGYYWAYSQHNSLENMFATIINENTQRTAVDKGWNATLIHLFTFPFEIFYHFLPWTFLAVYFFRKKNRQLLMQNEFMVFCALTFGANILIYWISAEVYPRYLLMLIPFIFGSLLYIHQYQTDEQHWTNKAINIFLKTIAILASIAILIPLFLPRYAFIPMRLPKVIVLTLLTWTAVYFFFKWKAQRLLLIVAILLLIRIGFNWFILPDRHRIELGTEVRNSSIYIGQKYKEEDLYIFRNTGLQPTNAFYITRERARILERKKSHFKKNDHIIVHCPKYQQSVYTPVDSLLMRYQKTWLDVGNNIEIGPDYW